MNKNINEIVGAELPPANDVHRRLLEVPLRNDGRAGRTTFYKVFYLQVTSYFLQVKQDPLQGKFSENFIKMQ